MPNSRPHIIITNEAIPQATDRVYQSGGGGGTYQRASYQIHATKIYKEASELKAIFAKSAVSTDPREKVYFRVELPEKDFSVWSGDGTTLEEKIHAKIVGSPEKNVAHVSTNLESFDSLIEQLLRYKDTPQNTGKSSFAQIERFEKISISEKLSARLLRYMRSDDFDGDVLISFFSDLNRDEKATYKRSIQEFLKKNGGKITGEYDSEIGLLLRISASKKNICRIARRFLAVQSVEPNEELAVSSSVVGNALDDNIIVEPNPGKSKACLFDSGVITGSRFLDASILGREEPLGPAINPDHGTFVASRIIYGDTILDQISQGRLRPDVRVLSVCLFPHDGIGNRVSVSTEKLMQTIRNTVERWHREIKVYNLSVNLMSSDPNQNSAVSDDIVNPLAAEVDLLSKKFDVLFIISTGNFPCQNSPNPTTAYPIYFSDEFARICPPAEANLGIAVGSIATKQNAGSMAQQNFPSPFTRRGPGFAKYRKPDLVAHGGNYASGWRRLNELSTVGFGSQPNSISYNNGTSFSAPLVTRLAAHLFAEIPNATSSLVRAMLIHFADIHAIPNLTEEEMINLVGNGIPNPLSLVKSDRWSQNFLFQGTVSDRKIQKIPFYVPNALVGRKGRNIVGVKVTIAFNSETDRTLKSGYCKSHLRTNLLKLSPTNGEVKVNRDTNLITMNDMYSTVLRRENRFSSGIQGGDWILSVEHISRWELKDPNVKFGAVVTVFDPRKDTSIDIHNAIRTEVPNRYANVLNITNTIMV